MTYQKTKNEYSKEYPLTYNGSLVWPVLFLILFLPLGILLVVLKTSVRRDGVNYSLHYRGSEGWLFFWTLLFFPVAIIFGFLNGFDVRGEDIQD